MTLKVTTFSSKGRVTRLYSRKYTSGIVHLQSDNQLRVFLALEWDKDVKKIEVNTELINLEETLENIDNLNLNRFKNKETGDLFKLYTNFLVTIESYKGIYNQVAISVKSVSELERKSVIEKLEIEKRYWNKKGVRFYLITDKEIDKVFTNNILWVREVENDNSLRNKDELAEKLYYFMVDNKEIIINKLLKHFDKIEGIKEGSGLFLFRYLIANKQISVDMKKNINLNEKIKKVVDF